LLDIETAVVFRPNGEGDDGKGEDGFHNVSQMAVKDFALRINGADPSPRWRATANSALSRAMRRSMVAFMGGRW
jgi:hypothetical protein